MFRLYLTIHCLILAVTFWSGQSCSGAEAQFSELAVGISGQGKPGKWLPVRAIATGLPTGETVELHVELPDPRGDVCIQTVAAGIVDGDGRISLSGYCNSGRLAGTGVLSIVNDGQTYCHSQLAFGEDNYSDPESAVQTHLNLRRLDALTLLTVGNVEMLEEFVRNVALHSPDRTILQDVQLPSMDHFPQDGRGLDTVDVILLAEEFATTPAQTQALRDWVCDGGSLFVSSGESLPRLLQTPIGQWLDHYFEFDDQPLEVRRFSTLEAFVPGASGIQTRLQNRETWPVASSRSPQSTVLVDSVDGPIVARQSVGAGVVTIVALDVNQLPLKDWPSLPQFYEVLLLGKKLSQESSNRSRTSRISQSGVSDLGTQLLASIDASPEGGQWSTWAVMAMLIAWLIAIGPIDYLVVNRLLKRPHLTWVTFPLLIVAGSYAIVSAGNTATAVRIQELRVLDVLTDNDRTVVTGRSWSSVSSPDTTRVTCRAELPMLHSTKRTQLDTRSHALTWSGRPEDIFGAMYRQGGIGLGRQTYRRDVSSPDRLTNVPLLTDGSRGFYVKWHNESKTPLFDSKLNVSGYGLLNGSFTHQLPGPIKNWRVIHGNRIYRPSTDTMGELPPNTDWHSQTSGIAALDLKAYLNDARLVDASEMQGKDDRDYTTQVQTPYDARSKDKLYILAMSNFYDVAGGAEYVGLSNAQLRHMEISDSIRLNHAVLIGFLDVNDASLIVEGVDNTVVSNETMVRVFLPVDRRPAQGMAPTIEDLEEKQSDSDIQD